MKTLTNVAVYGLVPVPASADTHACSDNDNRPPAAADANAAQLAWLRHDAAERMATNDELARILRELEALSADPSRH
jgi:hypothetical protein